MEYEEKYQTRVQQVHEDIGNWQLLGDLWRLRDLKQDERDLKILEYGCGYGFRINTLPNAIGYDISKYAVAICKQRGIEATTELPKEKFDIIILAHSLEHLEEPMKTLKELRTMLKPKGKVIIILPEDFHFKLDKNDVHQHLYCWNLQTLYNLLCRAGFKVENCGRAPIPTMPVKLKFLLKFLGLNNYFKLTTLAGKVFNRYELRAIGCVDFDK